MRCWSIRTTLSASPRQSISRLEMSPAERHERMQRMRRHVMEYNIYMWAAKVLGDLRELRLEPAEGAELSRVAPSSIRSAEIPVEKLA